MHDHDKQIPIWFFIGALLAVYGLIIAGYALLTLHQPPPPNMPEEIYKLHAPIWWGVLLACLGIFYVVRFWPSKPESLTGRVEDK
jgi:heme/copper-type cytochrome/quinol oxidase subunit 3